MFLRFPIIMISAVIFLKLFFVMFYIYVRVIIEFLRDVFFNTTETETVTTICV